MHNMDRINMSSEGKRLMNAFVSIDDFPCGDQVIKPKPHKPLVVDGLELFLDGYAGYFKTDEYKFVSKSERVILKLNNIIMIQEHLDNIFIMTSAIAPIRVGAAKNLLYKVRVSIRDLDLGNLASIFRKVTCDINYDGITYTPGGKSLVNNIFIKSIHKGLVILSDGTDGFLKLRCD